MAKNYYQQTGALNLKKITPVIKALFGVFEVQKHDDSVAYIKHDDNDISYESVASQIVTAMGLDPVDTSVTDSVEDRIIAMAEKLGKKDEVQAFLGDASLDQSEDADVEFLFQLALLMDDGHGLSSAWASGAWTCDRMRLGEFGGDGVFIGKNFTINAGSYTSDQYGSAVDNAIGENDFEQAAKLISNISQGLLNGIHDEAARNSVTLLLADLLQQKIETAASLKM